MTFKTPTPNRGGPGKESTPLNGDWQAPGPLQGAPRDFLDGASPLTDRSTQIPLTYTESLISRQSPQEIQHLTNTSDI